MRTASRFASSEQTAASRLTGNDPHETCREHCSREDEPYALINPLPLPQISLSRSIGPNSSPNAPLERSSRFGVDGRTIKGEPRSRRTSGGSLLNALYGGGGAGSGKIRASPALG